MDTDFSGIPLNRLLEQRTRELQASEARFRNIITRHADGIIITDGTGRMRYVNPASEILLERTADELIGAMFGFPLVNGETTELDVIRPKGSPAIAEMRVVETEWEGEPAYLASLRDVTERKHAEEERARLLEATRTAEAANKAKDEFLAIVSHELRTPLTAISGWIHALRHTQLQPTELERGFQVIQNNTDTLKKLINDLLDVSRITTGKLRIDLQLIDPRSLIEAVIESQRVELQRKKITLNFQADPTISRINGDPVRFQQIVWNLLTNAISFTPDLGLINLRLRQHKSLIEFSIEDTGEGIARDFLPYVFDRFSQADTSVRRRHGGLGLGLSIVRTLVELHGGTIQAASAGKGHGATFTIAIPVADPLEESLPAPDRTVTGDQAIRLDGLRILVVDDEPEARLLITRVLERHGAQVKTVASVGEALSILVGQNNFEADLLVSDLMLPEEDGFELIRRVRAMEKVTRKRLRAIALTAFDDEVTRMRALPAGFELHLAKPVDPQKLVSNIIRLTQASAPEAAH